LGRYKKKLEWIFFPILSIYLFYKSPQSDLYCLVVFERKKKKKKKRKKMQALKDAVKDYSSPTFAPLKTQTRETDPLLGPGGKYMTKKPTGPPRQGSVNQFKKSPQGIYPSIDPNPSPLRKQGKTQQQQQPSMQQRPPSSPLKNAPNKKQMSRPQQETRQEDDVGDGDDGREEETMMMARMMNTRGEPGDDYYDENDGTGQDGSLGFEGDGQNNTESNGQSDYVDEDGMNQTGAEPDFQNDSPDEEGEEMEVQNVSKTNRNGMSFGNKSKPNMQRQEKVSRQESPSSSLAQQKQSMYESSWKERRISPHEHKKKTANLGKITRHKITVQLNSSYQDFHKDKNIDGVVVVCGSFDHARTMFANDFLKHMKKRKQDNGEDFTITREEIERVKRDCVFNIRNAWLNKTWNHSSFNMGVNTRLFDPTLSVIDNKECTISLRRLHTGDTFNGHAIRQTPAMKSTEETLTYDTELALLAHITPRKLNEKHPLNEETNYRRVSAESEYFKAIQYFKNSFSNKQDVEAVLNQTGENHVHISEKAHRMFASKLYELREGHFSLVDDNMKFHFFRTGIPERVSKDREIREEDLLKEIKKSGSNLVDEKGDFDLEEVQKWMPKAWECGFDLFVDGEFYY
jgi:hypothetical protein